jgi:alpha-galactosidase
MRICGDAGARGAQHASAWDYLLYPAVNKQWMSGPGHYVYMNGQPALNFPLWMTVDDLKAWFGISGLMSQPLISEEPTSITATEMQLVYTNADFLSIAQDLAGLEGWPVSTNGKAQTWVRPLANGDWAVGLWNQATNSTATVSCLLSDLTGVLTNVVYVRDVYYHTDFFATNSFTATVNTNGLNLYRVLLSRAGGPEGGSNSSQGSASGITSPHDPTP